MIHASLLGMALDIYLFYPPLLAPEKLTFARLTYALLGHEYSGRTCTVIKLGIRLGKTLFPAGTDYSKFNCPFYGNRLRQAPAPLMNV